MQIRSTKEALTGDGKFYFIKKKTFKSKEKLL